LKNLKKLDVSNNNLLFQLTPLSALKNLLVLNLSNNNQINAQSLLNLSTMTMLEELLLSYCTINNDALESIANLVSLKKVDLNNCDNITSSGIDHFSLLTNLQQISLFSSKSIDFTLCTYLAPITTLKSIPFSNIHISELLSHISHLDIDHLSFERCVFMIDIKPFVSNFHNLTELEINECRDFNKTDTSFLSVFVNLKILNLNNTLDLTSDGLSHILHLTNLQILNLRNCEGITSEALSYFSLLINLKSLLMYGCNKITDDGLQFISGLTNLNVLDLNCCSEISSAGIVHLSLLGNLKKLYLNFSKVTSEGLVHISGLTKLRNLNLSFCDISIDGLDYLTLLVNLELLQVSGCSKLEGVQFKSHFSRLRRLIIE